MNYKVSHRTTYEYAYPVSVGNHVVCLKPRSFVDNELLSYSLRIEPAPVTLSERVDYFGNLLAYFTVQEPHKELVVEAKSEIVRGCGSACNGRDSLPWEMSTAALADDHTPEGLEAYQFQFESPRIKMRPEYAAYALASFTPGRTMREALLDLTHRIHTDFKFDSKVTTVRTSTEEVFKKRRGVCQDFAHVQTACLRSIGVAARYVSGYLRTYPPPGKPRLVGADASHAWVSAYCRGAGWLDMDPTNDVAPSDGHVTLAWGRDYGDVSPVRGLILGGGGHALKVAVDMEPVEG
ncbi:Transglutaminase-like enzyme, putative cysteine protease [Granulicella rosea]|uniref:Transglutaminase-like enzyme, putative cysteine protease n=1 Tax=Granulicella rosea TaxID=474952 RepID=A0A239MGA7_9BACT|nr:transglutaminase family protein [Granulicella rosea]SNT41142.1 Transglutaminase-like enzyme, putative cysteine protease [Granulicella rosea]